MGTPLKLQWWKKARTLNSGTLITLSGFVTPLDNPRKGKGKKRNVLICLVFVARCPYLVICPCKADDLLLFYVINRSLISPLPFCLLLIFSPFLLFQSS